MKRRNNITIKAKGKLKKLKTRRNSKSNTKQPKRSSKSNQRFLEIDEKEKIISLEESENLSNSEKEEEEKEIISIKPKNKARKVSIHKRLLNKKKLKNKSKSKEKEKSTSRNRKSKKKEPEELDEEEGESEEEEDFEESEELELEQLEQANKNKSKEKKEVFLPLDKTKKNKMNENIEKIDINDYKEDTSITCQNHNIIEDCCLECNEKNIFRAIKTNDKSLFIKCLKAINKISSLEYKLPMLCQLTPLEYIIKAKNKILYTELINYLKKNRDEQRVSFPKNKLQFMESGKRNYYRHGFYTRSVGVSRGNKLGNNAFLISESNEDFDIGLLNKYQTNKNENDKFIFFHKDEDFINFNNFAKQQELNDYEIEQLLEENINKGNINIVEYLMSIFSAREEYNYNQLHLQVTSQKPNAEKNIEIKNKMSLNKNNYMHITPVHLACINPNEKILSKLLENGAELNFQDKLGQKPISYAAMCSKPGPLKILIELNSNLNDRDNLGFTPLVHACRTSRDENVKILLEKGADPMIKPKSGKCMAIHYACMQDTENNLKIVKYLLKHNAELLNSNGTGRKSPLHFAVLYNCPKIVQFLVKSGANLDKKDKYWRTPLLLACKYGYSHIAEYLIKCGAKINKCDNSNNSPLHYACAFGNMDCVKVLLDNGADINCLNMWKNLPIEIALLKNHTGIVNYLLNNNKFSVNTPFGNGNTFLLYYLSYIEEATFEKIKFIIEKKKGSAKISNNNKMNAFHFLSYFTYKNYLSEFLSINEIKKLNEEKHKKIYHPKYINILKQYVTFLKDNGCEVDLKNNIGQSPLLFALKKRNFEYATILIENYKTEIDIKHMDNNGLNIFDYTFNLGNSLYDECILFIKTLLKLYDKELDKTFLNSYTRYGRNPLINLCEDFALHIYERFYNMNKKNAIAYIRKKPEVNDSSSLELIEYYIPSKYLKNIFDSSYQELKIYITKTFYPLIEEFIKKGCDINCYTQEKKFVNKKKEFKNYIYFNNYGKIYPIMYLMSYPESENLIKLIKKYKIDINCTDAKGQTLLMYLLEVQAQIKRIDKNNYEKIFDFLINNCNNLAAKNKDNKNLFVTELEKGNNEDALKIYKKLGDKVDINYPYYNNYLTLFGQALLDSNNILIDFFLTNFKNINLNLIDTKYNRNVLHYICMENSTKKDINFQKFAKFLNLDVSLSAKDILGRNPLYYLFIDENNKIKEEDPISVLSYLLESYESKFDKKSKTKKELDLNTVDIMGNPLIFYAVKSNAAFCVSHLLGRGAKIKGIKNLENNSVFSYALLANSTSIQELYNEVNDIKVFEDKIYEINNDLITKTIKDAEDKIENKKDTYNYNNNNYCAEELFNFNYNTNKYEIKEENDNNLEKLYEEND